jgi:hypothetical protein
MNHQIKHRLTGAVLFECEVPEQQSGMATRYTLEKAVQADANLADANLAGANLARANLADAYLAGANLADANLADANLARAYLAGANLAGANLAGAKFSGDKLLIGKRPFLTIGPIGSRCALVSLWLTDKGPMVKAGCFTGTLDEFTAAVDKTHGDTDHGKEYAMAILMMESHAAIWTPEAA